MDGDRFSRDMLGDIASMRVALDMRRGKSMGVVGTPTIFIDGRMVDAKDVTPEGLRIAINSALQVKGK
jgi:protein-disulfide isomerase